MSAVPRMIIVNLIGGLGNQMFQYACGFALGRDTGLNVKVATDMFTEYRRHNGAQLGRVFRASLSVAGLGDMRRLIGRWRVRPRIRKCLGHGALAPLRGRYFIVEQEFGYNERLQELAGQGAYLQGYWQSERYFVKHADALRREFAFRSTPTGRNAELAHEIRNGESVSLHVRRGDYANCPKTRAFHGLCEPDYYLRAIEFLRSQVPGFRLFAFSDDPLWVAATLQSYHPEMVVVNHNVGKQSYYDMLLMSMCRHHIIANSSFSWWGAWLNPDPNKTVIAPRNWFAGDQNTADLIPENWIRL